jgi:hypothetical protein
VLVLDIIEILPPLVKYKYDTWRILSVKCYIDNFVRLRSCIQNVNTNCLSSIISAFTYAMVESDIVLLYIRSHVCGSPMQWDPVW